MYVAILQMCHRDDWSSSSSLAETPSWDRRSWSFVNYCASRMPCSGLSHTFNHVACTCPKLGLCYASSRSHSLSHGDTWMLHNSVSVFTGVGGCEAHSSRTIMGYLLPAWDFHLLVHFDILGAVSDCFAKSVPAEFLCNSQWVAKAQSLPLEQPDFKSTSTQTISNTTDMLTV